MNLPKNAQELIDNANRLWELANELRSPANRRPLASMEADSVAWQVARDNAISALAEHFGLKP